MLERTGCARRLAAAAGSASSAARDDALAALVSILGRAKSLVGERGAALTRDVGAATDGGVLRASASVPERTGAWRCASGRRRMCAGIGPAARAAMRASSAPRDDGEALFVNALGLASARRCTKGCRRCTRGCWRKRRASGSAAAARRAGSAARGCTLSAAARGDALAAGARTDEEALRVGASALEPAGVRRCTSGRWRMRGCIGPAAGAAGRVSSALRDGTLAAAASSPGSGRPFVGERGAVPTLDGGATTDGEVLRVGACALEPAGARPCTSGRRRMRGCSGPAAGAAGRASSALRGGTLAAAASAPGSVRPFVEERGAVPARDAGATTDGKALCASARAPWLAIARRCGDTLSAAARDDALFARASTNGEALLARARGLAASARSAPREKLLEPPAIEGRRRSTSGCRPRPVSDTTEYLAMMSRANCAALGTAQDPRGFSPAILPRSRRRAPRTGPGSPPASPGRGEPASGTRTRRSRTPR